MKTLEMLVRKVFEIEGRTPDLPGWCEEEASHDGAIRHAATPVFDEDNFEFSVTKDARNTKICIEFTLIPTVEQHQEFVAWNGSFEAKYSWKIEMYQFQGTMFRQLPRIGGGMFSHHAQKAAKELFDTILNQITPDLKYMMISRGAIDVEALKDMIEEDHAFKVTIPSQTLADCADEASDPEEFALLLAEKVNGIDPDLVLRNLTVEMYPNIQADI